jgi:hypothetical protein
VKKKQITANPAPIPQAPTQKSVYKAQKPKEGPSFNDIPQFPRAHYEVDISWDYLEDHLKHYFESYNLDLDPDFQRAHIWTREQQTAYVEYCLMGGEVGRNLTFNHPSWNTTLGRDSHRMEIIDGKQRLEAVRSFLRNEFPVFSHKFLEYTDFPRIATVGFRFRICSLETREQILQMYLNINAGGTPHTKEELDKVRNMLSKERSDVNK